MAKSLNLNFIEAHITDLAKLAPLIAQGIFCVPFACTSEYMLEAEGGCEQRRGSEVG